MNIGHILENDRKFPHQSIRLYRRIDRYVDLLGLNAKTVEGFKSDVEAVVYVTGRYKSFSESFVLFHIATIKKRFALLKRACVKSENYTRKIGEELGIEAHSKFNVAKFWEIGLFNFCQN
jgi:hypothetical protein